VSETNGIGQTRERRKMSRLLRQVLNPFVSRTTRIDSVLSQRVKTRNVSSVEQRQRGGLCLEGVSHSLQNGFATKCSSRGARLTRTGY